MVSIRRCIKVVIIRVHRYTFYTFGTRSSPLLDGNQEVLLYTVLNVVKDNKMLKNTAMCDKVNVYFKHVQMQHLRHICMYMRLPYRIRLGAVLRTHD